MAFGTSYYLSNNLDTLVFCELRVYLICKVVNFHGKKKKNCKLSKITKAPQ